MLAKFTRKLLAIILIFSFSSCSRDNQNAALSISNVPTITPEAFFDLWIEHSPNGEWDAYLSPLITTVVITSTISGTSFKDNFQVGPYNGIVSWFPDNSGFIVLDANQGCQKCPFDRLTTYHIDAQAEAFLHFEFEPLLEPNTALSYQHISWSRDGSQFAIIVGEFNQEQIYILDRYANVIRIVEPQLSEHQTIDQVTWFKDSLIYTVRDLGKSPQPTEIRMINLDEQAAVESILRHEPDDPYIISASSESDYLLISTKRLSESSFFGEIGVFDLKTLQFVKIIYQYSGENKPYFNYVEANNRPIIGFQLYNRGDALFVFDWNTQELFNTQVPIDALLGWQEDQNSFIVVRSDRVNKHSQWIELIPFE